MSDLRSEVQKLASEHPELRKHLIPLMKEASPSRSTAWAWIMKDSVVFDFAWKLGKEGQVSGLVYAASKVNDIVEDTVEDLGRVLGGKAYVHPSLEWGVNAQGLLIGHPLPATPHLSGVFQLSDAVLRKKFGTFNAYVKAVEATLGKHFQVDDISIRRDSWE